MANETKQLPAKPPEKAAASVESKPLPVKTAAELNGHLAESGSPIASSEIARNWLKANPEATAEAYYRWMDSAKIKLGTLRKAGKWTFGTDFEPESAGLDAPADEIKMLRRQNAQLSDQVAELQAQLAAARRHSRNLEQSYERDREVRLNYPEQPLGVSQPKKSALAEMAPGIK